MPKVAISLGSNIGDRLSTLRTAMDRLAELGRMRSISPLYETAPIGPVDQGYYLNAVAVLDTELPPTDLMERLLAVEEQLGRVRGVRWGPRTIDLDLILHGDTVIETETVTVPHPRYRDRRFVLEPLVAAWPDACHPDGTVIAKLLAGVADQEVRRIGPTGWYQDGGGPSASIGGSRIAGRNHGP